MFSLQKLSLTQFSVRTLLVLCAIVALELKFGFVSEGIRQYTISRVHAAGGRVHYDKSIQAIWKSQKIVLIDAGIPSSLEFQKYQLNAFPNLIEARFGPLQTDPNVTGGAVVDIEHDRFPKRN